MLRRLAFPLALLGALCVAAGAYAGSGDRNNDRIPDRWEKRHHLSLEVKQTRRDQDGDGLDNLAEWRSHTNPRDRDSDDDGIRDEAEHAGRIVSFSGGVLTIRLFDGGRLSAKVTAATEVKCENEDGVKASRHGDDDEPGDDHGGDRDRTCAPGALKAGAVVEEAELKVTATGRIWDEIELR